jgi:hypothetical protein
MKSGKLFKVDQLDQRGMKKDVLRVGRANQANWVVLRQPSDGFVSTLHVYESVQVIPGFLRSFVTMAIAVFDL